MTQTPRAVRMLALAAVVSATGALAIDVAAPAVPGVAPLELARWIRDGRPGLDVIDIREPSVYEAGHIPTSRNLPATQFDPAWIDPSSTAVLYGETGADAAALARTVSKGRATEILVLERGIGGWLADVMAPRLSDDAGAAERAAFEEQAELSRWFGGLPRVVPAASNVQTDSPAERSKRLLGGC